MNKNYKVLKINFVKTFSEDKKYYDGIKKGGSVVGFMTRGS